MAPFQSMAYGINGQYFTVQTDALNAFMVALEHLASQHNITVGTPTLEQVGPDLPTITIKFVCYPPYPSSTKALPSDTCAYCSVILANVGGGFIVCRDTECRIVCPRCRHSHLLEGWQLSTAKP
jgi:hypothetical protein